MRDFAEGRRPLGRRPYVRFSRPLLAAMAIAALAIAALAIAALSPVPTSSAQPPSPPSASDDDGLFFLRSEERQAVPGALAVRPAGRVPFVRIGARIRPLRAQVYATQNDNQRYAVWIRHAHGGDRSRCRRGVLRVGPHVQVSSGYGSDDESCSLSFWVDQTVATAAAAHFDTPRQDRRPVGRAVRATFEPARQEIRAGEPLRVRLKLHNPAGAPTVLRLQGGRNRGPRNDRFSFAILRDGQPVEPRTAFNFGGLSQYLPMPPGSEATLEARLEEWVDLSVPGRYELRCRYETSFAPEGARVHDDGSRAVMWDRAFTGTIRFTVRP